MVCLTASKRARISSLIALLAAAPPRTAPLDRLVELDQIDASHKGLQRVGDEVVERLVPGLGCRGPRRCLPPATPRAKPTAPGTSVVSPWASVSVIGFSVVSHVPTLAGILILAPGPTPLEPRQPWLPWLKKKSGVQLKRVSNCFMVEPSNLKPMAHMYGSESPSSAP